MALNSCVRPALVPSSRIEQIVAGLDFAATLDQLQRSQPAHGIVEAAAVRLISGFGCDFLFGERTGILLGKRLQNEPLGLAEAPAPVVNQRRTLGERLPGTERLNSRFRNDEPVSLTLDQLARPESTEIIVKSAAVCSVASKERHLHLASAIRVLGKGGQNPAFP
jgi:hypothetical protein